VLKKLLLLPVLLIMFSSYKEQSEHTTDSEDVVEGDVDEVEPEADDIDTIERVLHHRIGKKGGRNSMRIVC